MLPERGREGGSEVRHCPQGRQVCQRAGEERGGGLRGGGPGTRPGAGSHPRPQADGQQRAGMSGVCVGGREGGKGIVSMYV